MKLYKEILIETAEQAEALPGKTPILTLSPEGETWESCLREDIDSDALAPSDGWTCLALVPIEAEEGVDTIQAGVDNFYTRSRYVTPWEEA